MTNQTDWAHAASSAKDNVHLGTWINWSRGRVMGATLTLNRVEGNFLIAFTALFVGVVTERFWRIACMFYSSPKPGDGLYHQHQAILRNSSSTVSAIWTLSQLLWAWQNVAKRCFIRVLPTLLAAVICLGAFTVAGGFSSSISSGISDEVLLNGTNCGIIDYTIAGAEAARILRPYNSQVAHSATNYAQQCYSPDSSGNFDSAGMFDCKYFVKDRILSTVDNQASCPFHDNICRSNNSNIRLDTGYLSILNDLGANAPADQDILFRAVLHCAPIEAQGYTESIYDPLDNFTGYKYGSHVSGSNYTYVAESIDSQYRSRKSNPFRSQGRTFILSSQVCPVYNRSRYEGFNEVDTIPALFNPDADTTLIFLSGNGIKFYDKTNDPWYRATVPGVKLSFVSSDGEYLTTYRPDEAASPMGCTEQFQFCNPTLSSSKCGPLASIQDAQIQSAPLFGMTTADFENTSLPNDTMASRYQWFVWITSYVTSAGAIVNALGPNSLTSLKYFSDGLVGSLPDDQWQLDVKNWWATYLALLQAGFVNAARGSTDPALDPFKHLAFNSHTRAMCNNQKIRSTKHVSFSLFGLYFTFLTGLFIIIISYALEPIFKCLYRRRKYKEHVFLEWAASETLQLQRIGFQAKNEGMWTGCTDSIPTTKPGEILASLAQEHSLDSESTLEANRTLHKATRSRNVDSNRASFGQEEDLVSLDDLLDTSTFPNSGSP